MANWRQSFQDWINFISDQARQVYFPLSLCLWMKSTGKDQVSGSLMEISSEQNKQTNRMLCQTKTWRQIWVMSFQIHNTKGQACLHPWEPSKKKCVRASRPALHPSFFSPVKSLGFTISGSKLSQQDSPVLLSLVMSFWGVVFDITKNSMESTKWKWEWPNKSLFRKVFRLHSCCILEKGRRGK